MIVDLVVILREAAKPTGATPAAFSLYDLAAAESMMMIRRFGVDPIWRLTPRGKTVLKQTDG